MTQSNEVSKCVFAHKHLFAKRDVFLNVCAVCCAKTAAAVGYQAVIKKASAAGVCV